MAEHPARSRAVKVLQVGCGNFGPAHISAWQALGLGAQLYVADPDPKAQARARSCGVREENITGDFKTMLDQVDIVDIVVPLPAHLPVALAALDAGRHVLLEKPATATVEQARELVDCARKAGTKVQIGYQLRFHPLSVAMKKMMTDGALGKPVYLAAQYSGFKRLRADSGVLTNDAVRFLDLARWLLGSPPQSVFAELRDDLGCGAAGLALIVLRYPGGVVARIEAGRTGVGHLPDTVVPGAITTHVLTLVGSLGAAEVDYHAGTLLHRRARFEARDGIWSPEFGEVSELTGQAANWGDVMGQGFTEFLDAIENDTASPVPVAEAALDMAVLCEAIERSSQTGARIQLEAGS